MAKRNQSLKSDVRTAVSTKGDSTLGIHELLRLTRLDRHLTQEELARKLGLRQRQISDLERATVDPRLSTIQNVARALDLELMLIPRPLIATVESLQRSGADSPRRPMYALGDDGDDDDETELR
jgi:transcriptional regulator with XRE-family HTH domain